MCKIIQKLRDKWRNFKNHYRPAFYQALLWLIVLFIMTIACFVFPFILKWVYGIFRNHWNEADINILPDFLGGLFGILVGVVIDWLIIDKIKRITDYKNLIKVLLREINAILGDMPGLKNALRSGRVPDNVLRWAIDDICSSIANESVILNIPFGKKFGKDLSASVHALNKAIMVYSQESEDEYENGGDNIDTDKLETDLKKIEDLCNAILIMCEI